MELPDGAFRIARPAREPWAHARVRARRDDDDILQAAESEDEYIRCCGIVGLGFILVRSRDKAVLNSLTEATTSASWRAREAAAMAVQAIGDTDPELFRAIIEQWARSAHPLTLRAAAAGICEPRLLKDKTNAVLAVRVCRDATEWIVSQPADSRREADTRTLRQALGYCWSVAVAADPENACRHSSPWRRRTTPMSSGSCGRTGRRLACARCSKADPWNRVVGYPQN